MESIGLYQLGKTIGKGSYGKVRLGVHTETGKQVLLYFISLLLSPFFHKQWFFGMLIFVKVAVKIVHYNNAKSKKQLEREIAIISRLQHPSILSFLYTVFLLFEILVYLIEY